MDILVFWSFNTSWWQKICGIDIPNSKIIVPNELKLILKNFWVGHSKEFAVFRGFQKCLSKIFSLVYNVIQININKMKHKK